MKAVENKRDDGVELETQVILRIPEEPAKSLRETIREGSNNLKDRLSVKLENDIRYGEVRFDHWLMHAKIVDLPTVIESLKTIDNKSFYKTADICQMFICKDEPDIPTPDEESPNKNKKKDPNKVDKKFLWPHGVTAPCKNVRKRRFRKTLKKKFVEAPEIEKEVKRLLRADNEAVNCKWDIINEEEDSKNQLLQGELSSSMQESPGRSNTGGLSEKHTKKSKSNKDKSTASSIMMMAGQSVDMPRDIDIFGEDVSSSDDEDHHNINVELDETSRLTGDDSRLTDDYLTAADPTFGDKLVTEFNKTMFNNGGSIKKTTVADFLLQKSRLLDVYDSDRILGSDDNDFLQAQMSQDTINAHIVDLRRQLNELRKQRILKKQEISSIKNQALRQRLQGSLNNILSQIIDREIELQEYQLMRVQ